MQRNNHYFFPNVSIISSPTLSQSLLFYFFSYTYFFKLSLLKFFLLLFLLGEISWLDKNKFSLSFDIFTTGRSLREKEKNRRRAIIVGGGKLPWFSVETVSHYGDDDNNNNDNNNLENDGSIDEFDFTNCCQPKFQNSSKNKNLNYDRINKRKNENVCIPTIKINNSFERDQNNKKTKLKIMNENSYSESESLRICFNHIGVHYDCYEQTGLLGK